MSSECWLVGWVISTNDEVIKVLRRNRKIRLSRNKTHPNIAIGDWIAFRKNTESGQGCLIQIIDPALPTKIFWIESRMESGSPQTQCICVKTIAINSPDVQLQESDHGIHTIWSPHFEKLADPLGLFNDPVNVKPNVAYDVWCRLNSDPESQYDGVSPILEIHSIEAPSESQKISLSPLWVRGSVCSPNNQALSLNLSHQNQQFPAQCPKRTAEARRESGESPKMCEEEPSPSTSSVPRNASIPIDQASSLDQPSSNHQSTVQSQEPSAQTQQQATESQKMHEEEHSRPLVGGETSSNHTLTSPGNQQAHTETNEGTANNQMSSVKNRNDLEAVQEITAVDLKPLVTTDEKKVSNKVSEENSETAVDLIMKQLVERRTLYQKHRQEANATKNLSEKQSLSMNQWITEEVQRIDHASNLFTFFGCTAHGDTWPTESRASLEKIIRDLRPVIRAQLRFHQKCAEKMDPKDLKWQNLFDATRKQLEMSDKELDENVLASSLAMQIIRRLCGSENVGTQQEPSKNQQSPAGNQQKSSNIQLSTKNDPKMSRNTQKSTPGSQECTAKKQQKAAASVKKTPMDQRSLEEAPKMKTDSVDSTKQLAEVQGEPEGTAGTSIDLITQLLCERLKMVQSHRKECEAAIQFLDNSSMVALMRHQRKQQMDGREQYTKIMAEFAANLPKGCYASRYRYEETSRILRKLSSELRSYLAFYLSCVIACNENGTKDEKEQIRKKLDMKERDFNENVALSKEVLSVLDAYSPSTCPKVAENHVPPAADVQSSQKTHTKEFPTGNSELKDKQSSAVVQQSSLINPGPPTKKEMESSSKDANKLMESSNPKQSGSGNNEQPKTAIEFIVDQLKERRDLLQTLRQKACAAEAKVYATNDEKLSAKQSLSRTQWMIEKIHRDNQASALKAFLESNPQAEKSLPQKSVVSKTSVKKILGELRFHSRAQIGFHRYCAERMNPEDAFSKIVLDTTKKWLEMDREQFEDNVLASPLAMRIIRRTFASRTTTNQPNPGKAVESSNPVQSGSVNDKQPKTAIEFIVSQLKERRSLYERHRQEANAAKQLRVKQILSAQQWVIEGNQRENQASALKTFLESNPQAEESIPNSQVVSRASITKIIQQSQLHIRAQIRFHQECAKQMNPKDAFSKIVLDTAKKWLEMDMKQFEDNVLASPLAMRIIRRTTASGKTKNQSNPNEPMESSSVRKSGSGNSKQSKTAIEFIVDQLKERRDLYQKHRQEAKAAQELSVKQLMSVKQWLTEGSQRDRQTSTLEAFLESNPHAEKSIPKGRAVSEASIRKILQQMRSDSLAQIRFHQDCAKRMIPKDAFSEIVLEKTKKWLEMDTKQFEDNVLASPVAMRIIRRAFAGECTPNQPNP